MSKKIRFYLLLFLAAEAISFLGFLYPAVNTIGFFAVAVVALLLAVEKLRYGLLILFAELFIGSKGYLFSFEYEGALFSVRMALFLVVMSAWLGKVVLDWIDVSKAPALELEPWMKKGKDFVQQDLWTVHKKVAKQARELHSKATGTHTVYCYYGLLFVAIAWGVLNGYLRHAGFESLFFDVNGWMYFGIVFPFAYLAKHHASAWENFFKDIFAVFSAAVVWLSVKTLALFYIFSHDFERISATTYHWVRDTGVGEITPTGEGFSRIFIQSQIYIVIAVFVFAALGFYSLLHWQENKKTRKQKNKLLLWYYLEVILCTATVLVSLSRSFWVGLAAGILFSCFLVFLFFYQEWKKILVHAGLLLVSVTLGSALVVGVAAFPYPQAGIFNIGAFKDRLTELTGEAAVASRWNLLPVLVDEIKKAPFLGKGFGAQVTYITHDPRILAQNPSGEYTTYAFEWGWLDVWLKLGLVGVVAYLLLLGKIFFDGIKQIKKLEFRIQKLMTIALLSGLVMLVATNIFSPYLNHPLGIGFLIVTCYYIRSISSLTH